MKPNLLWLLPPAAVGTGFLLPALGHGGLNIQVIPISGDYFHNYDFRDQYCASETCADWPVTMFWGGNTEVADVHNYLEDIGYPRDSGGWMWAHVYENLYDDEDWDEDEGRQSQCDCVWDPFKSVWNGYMAHTRIYGYAGMYLYNSAYGYYAIGTTHYDINHVASCNRKYCQGSSDPGTQRFGWSETVAGRIAEAASNDGHSVTPKKYNAQNAGNFQIGDYDWHESDGWVTYINMSMK